MTDEEVLDLVIRLVDDGMSVPGAILAAIEIAEATPAAIVNVNGNKG